MIKAVALRTWKVVLTVGLAVAALSASGHFGFSEAGKETASADARTPEFYAYSQASHYCVMRLENDTPEFADRRKIMLDAISSLYERSRGWKLHFAVVGVDYLEFRHAYVVIFKPCSDRSAIEGEVAELKALTPMLITPDQSGRRLISSASVLYSVVSPAKRFEMFNPNVRLDRCIMLFDIRTKSLSSEQELTYQAISRVWVKYRLPFSDVNWRNDKIYVLLSRTCEAKHAIYSGLIEALARDHFTLSANVQFVASPDISDYLRAQPLTKH